MIDTNGTTSKVGRINTTVYPAASAYDPNLTWVASGLMPQTSTGALSDGWTTTREEVCCDGVAETPVDSIGFYKITLSEYQRLLGKVMDALDASIANKQQHAATTRIVRKAFDAMYAEMMICDGDYSSSSPLGSYAVEPIR